MESTGSNSPAPPASAAAARFNNPDQQLSDRVIRALSHQLRLLHRSDAYFFVLGATGNVYNVTLSATPSCTCPDRKAPCKHILFVFLRVLGLSLDDTCLRRRTLRPCQLQRLLGAPTSPEALAGVRARERFRQLFLESGGGAVLLLRACTSNPRPGATCPVCLEEMDGVEGGGLVACATCGNWLHEECFLRWKRSRGRRTASCVMCRARWRERKEQERYVNLAAYVSEDEMGLGAGGAAGLCAG